MTAPVSRPLALQTFPALGRAGLAAAVAGAVLLVIGAITLREQFFRSYLMAFELFLSLSLGALAITMLHHVTGGAWGFVLRRVFEAAIGNLVLLALLFLPILIGLPILYPWARPEIVANDPILQHKQLYLNPTAFTIRAAVYFSIWCTMAFLLRRWSADQDQRRDVEGSARRMRNLSGAGILIYALTVTFATIDFAMSLEPHWYSSVYALLMVVIQGLMALAFGTAFAAFARAADPLRGKDPQSHFHDLGNLMLAFVMLWAYMMFCQYLITWAGNLPTEIPWYLNRMEGGWGQVGVFLVLFHFVAPFLFLLFRDNKRNMRVLGALAGWLLLMVLVDFIWFLSPAFYPKQITIHWLDGGALLGIGGLWVFGFSRLLGRRPLIPLGDPDLPESFREAAKGGA